MMCAAGSIRGMYLGQIKLHLKTNLSIRIIRSYEKLSCFEPVNGADFGNDRDVGMKKKIALAVPTLMNGGAERAVSVWVNELYTRDYDVSIVVSHRSDGEYSVNPDIPIYSLTKETIEYESMHLYESLYLLKKPSVCEVY